MASDNSNAKVFDVRGKEVGSMPLSSGIFHTTVKHELVHGVVRWQRAKRRAGTHDVLTRSEMKGGGRKPYKQKGTGNARAGSIISPLWVGGAVVHGPTPRSYEFRLSKKVRKAALQSVLSAKASNGNFFVLESVAGSTGKTKDAAATLKGLGVYGSKVLVVLSNDKTADNENFTKAVRNIEGITALPVGGVNVYDLVNCTNVVCTKDALAQLEARLSGAVA
jgi:large subunit ribosomal protein L4